MFEAVMNAVHKIVNVSKLKLGQTYKSDVDFCQTNESKSRTQLLELCGHTEIVASC